MNGDFFNLDPQWWQAIAPFWDRTMPSTLRKELLEEDAKNKVYPPENLRFKAFEACSLDDVKVVILGQDPYHQPSQAMGLSFSVPFGVATPPSLKNIYKELFTDMGCAQPAHGNLSEWAERGVLLLNTALTVRHGEPGSHSKMGWHDFTRAVLSAINSQREHVVFILWGKHAQGFGDAIDRERHHVIESAHPSPLGAHRGFFGSKPFSRANTYLSTKGIEPVDWCIDPLTLGL